VNEVAKWVFDHRTNPYLPFGTIKYSSYRDYLWRTSLEYRQQNEKRKVKEQEAAKKRREQHQIYKREKNERTAVKANLRDFTILRLKVTQDRERWEEIALNESVTLDFYPKEWAMEPDEVFQSLPREIRLLLLRRLKHKKQGLWRDLYKRLSEL